MSGKASRMQNMLLHRLRITLVDGRQLTGQLLAFDKHMNMVLADCEEFRRLKRKTGAGEAEERRMLGLLILRGEHVISISIEAPPPSDNVGRTSALPTGPGIARPMGRGIPVGLNAPPSGLAGPVRGVGGPLPPPPMMGRSPMMMGGGPGAPMSGPPPPPPMMGMPPPPQAGSAPPAPPPGFMPPGYRPPQ